MCSRILGTRSRQPQATRSQVRISSIEQLDCAVEGTLAILVLDQTSAVDKQRFAANSLFWELMGDMGTDVLKAAFSNLLLKDGFLPSTGV